MVTGLVSLLRNLSYIVANEDAMAYHVHTLAHLVSLIPCWRTEAGGMAVDVIIALAKHLDVAGMPLVDNEEGVADDSILALAPTKVRSQRYGGATGDPAAKEFVQLIKHTFPVLMGLVGEWSLTLVPVLVG